jgi:hypothetical protein
MRRKKRRSCRLLLAAEAMAVGMNELLSRSTS